MSDEDWTFINQFRNNDETTPKDVMDMEIAMMRILNHFNIDQHSKDLGYSLRFPRYNTNFPGLTPKKELKALRQHYWARLRQVQNLEKIIKKKKSFIQKNCDHKWEKDLDARDHRSRYDCKKCGAYR
jgi:hypothetical protein